MRAACQVLSSSALLLLLSLELTAAGHYYGSTLSWEQVSGTKVKFSLISAWSTEYQPYKEQAYQNTIAVGDLIQVIGLGDPVLDFGDGTPVALVKARVIGVDSSRQIWRGVYEVEHEYASMRQPNGQPFMAEFSGCCREGTTDGYWNVTTTVDTSNNKMYSPRFALLSTQIIRSNLNDTFYVPAYDGGKHPTMDGMASRMWNWEITNGDPMFMIDNMGMVSGIVNQGMSAMTVKVTDVSDNLGVYAMTDFQVEVKMFNHTLPTFDETHPSALLPQPAINEVFTGYLYEFVFRFTIAGAMDPTASLVMQSTELPMGAALDATATYNSINPGYEAKFNWTTTQADMGWLVLCFQAFTNSSMPLGSKQICVDFSVLLDTPPTLSVELPTPLMHTAMGQPLEWSMGQQLSITLNAVDKKASDMGITISNTTMLPSNSMLSDARSGVDFAGINASRTFTWEPVPQAGGSSGTICFSANDEAKFAVGAGHQVCYNYRVPKCMYKVRANEALTDIAERFGTSWLQLWALNKKMIQRPEGHGLEGGISEGFDLHIGQLVLVKEGDTLERIAARFGTTLRQIINLNADLSPAQPLMVGQVVCLVPSSCMERA